MWTDTDGRRCVQAWAFVSLDQRAVPTFLVLKSQATRGVARGLAAASQAGWRRTPRSGPGLA